jgi:predicted esterase
VDTSAIVGLIGLSGPYDLDPSAPDLAPIFPPPATAADWQVLSHVTAGSPPALLLHGDRDDVVPRSAIDHLEAAIGSRGGEVETGFATRPSRHLEALSAARSRAGMPMSRPR